MCSFAETTHTPQGDGNQAQKLTGSIVIETTHTPQGDGNDVNAADNGAAEKQPTPRKGTETHTAGDLCTRWSGNNPHPARGRKRFPHCPPRSDYETTHTPQGDGNQEQHPDIDISIETTHTPQGDGNILNRIQNVCKKETTHTPQGDGNFLFCGLPSSARKQPTPRKGTETRRRC